MEAHYPKGLVFQAVLVDHQTVAIRITRPVSVKQTDFYAAIRSGEVPKN